MDHVIVVIITIFIIIIIVVVIFLFFYFTLGARAYVLGPWTNNCKATS